MNGGQKRVIYIGMPFLIFAHGTPQQREHPWHGKSLTLGRAPSNDLVLDHEGVSAYHARIEWRKDAFWVVDLNSTNGTRLNGEKITEARLRDGDALRFGKAVDCSFSVTAEELADWMAADRLAGKKDQKEPQQAEADQEAAHQEASEGTAALARQGGFCAACGVAIPLTVNFCPRCGAPATVAAAGNLPATPMSGRGGGALGAPFVLPIEGAGRGAGIFPLLAFLCGLASVGFALIAGICHVAGAATALLMVFYGLAGISAFFSVALGLMSLAAIRKHGGWEADRKHAMWGLSSGFLAAVGCLAGVVMVLTAEHLRDREDFLAKRIAENEERVLADLYGVARAQKFAKTTRVGVPEDAETGRYLPLEELAQLGISFVNRDLADGRAHGYRFLTLRADAASFQIVAEPERYGVTGKRTFSMDPSGIAHAQDLDGKSYAQAAQTLPDVGGGRTAFDDADDAIASEVIAVAKRHASRGNYELSRKLLDEVRNQFAITKAAQELLALEKSVNPFIIEAQAQTRYQQAAQAAAEGDLRLAIGRLREIVELYPSYSKIAAATEQLGRYQTQLAQKLDKEAKTLFERAEALEREGKPDAAQDLYVQIEKNYPETEWATRILQLRPALQKAIREKSAEQLFAQARSLSLTTEHPQIIALIEQLQRGYGETDYLLQNAEAVDVLYRKAQAQFYRVLAVEQMAAGQDRDALARLDEAAGKNPDLRVALKDLFLKLYPRVAQRLLDEGDERQALALYRKYLSLEPEIREISPAALARLNFAVAKSEFSLGNYKAAEANLIGAREVYKDDPEFNDILGMTLTALGKTEEALAAFDRAVLAALRVERFPPNLLARRGYLQLKLAQQIEQEALVAFALLMPAVTTPASAAAPLDPSLPAPSPSAPAAAAGAASEPRIRYDAQASEVLREEVLSLLEQIRGSTSPSGRAAPAPAPAAPAAGGGAPLSATKAISDARFQQMRQGMSFGNQLSALHQKVLDDAARKQKAADALRWMARLYAGGNRDLREAIQRGADRSSELQEILTGTAQREAKLTVAAHNIAEHLEKEILVSKAGYDTAASAYQRSQMQQFTAPTDTTVLLRTIFSKLHDRRNFDKGLQLLREAAEIKTPMELYAIVPETPVAASASAILPAR